MNWIVVVFALIFGQTALAKSDCQGLKAEIIQMQSAQKQILASLNSNHETAASSLEEYSNILESSQVSTDSLLVSKKMSESAKAFRTRGLQGKEIAAKLNQATEDLMGKIQNCLK